MFTSIEDIHAEAQAAAQQQQRAENAQLGGPKPTVTDVKTAKKAGEVHFKAQHGIVVAFFSFILYVSLNRQLSKTDNSKCPSRIWCLPVHDRLPPHAPRPSTQVQLRRPSS